jgi:hypothetical protein
VRGDGGSALYTRVGSLDRFGRLEGFVSRFWLDTLGLVWIWIRSGSARLLLWSPDLPRILLLWFGSTLDLALIRGPSLHQPLVRPLAPELAYYYHSPLTSTYLNLCIYPYPYLIISFHYAPLTRLL